MTQSPFRRSSAKQTPGDEPQKTEEPTKSTMMPKISLTKYEPDIDVKAYLAELCRVPE